MIELGKHYMAGDFGAEWLDPVVGTDDPDAKGGWFVMHLSTGNFVGDVFTVEDLLRDFPEFKDAKEVT